MNKPWYGQTWVIVVALVLFFPVGIYLMWSNKAWSERTMAIVTGIIGVLALLWTIGLVSSSGDSGTGDSSVAANPTEDSAPATATVEPQPSASPTQQAPSPTSTAKPQPTPTRPPTPAPPTEESKLDTIPGITAVDVTGPLENAGFDCSGPRKLQTLSSWSCSSDLSYADVLGTSPTRIQRASITALGLSDVEATAMLGFFATLPYDGADPTGARAWVNQNIAAGYAETVIGAVRFALEGDPGARSLYLVAVGAP